MKNSQELEDFTTLTDKLLKVPHDEVKDKLKRERQAKKRKKSKVSSASHEAGDKVQLDVALSLPVSSPPFYAAHTN